MKGAAQPEKAKPPTTEATPPQEGNKGLIPWGQGAPRKEQKEMKLPAGEAPAEKTLPEEGKPRGQGWPDLQQNKQREMEPPPESGPVEDRQQMKNLEQSNLRQAPVQPPATVQPAPQPLQPFREKADHAQPAEVPGPMPQVAPPAIEQKATPGSREKQREAPVEEQEDKQEQQKDKRNHQELPWSEGSTQQGPR